MWLDISHLGQAGFGKKTYVTGRLRILRGGLLGIFVP